MNAGEELIFGARPGQSRNLFGFQESGVLLDKGGGQSNKRDIPRSRTGSSLIFLLVGCHEKRRQEKKLFQKTRGSTSQDGLAGRATIGTPRVHPTPLKTV